MSEVPLYITPDHVRAYTPHRVDCDTEGIGQSVHNVYRGTLPMGKRPPPWDPPETLGIGLLQCPRGFHFLTSEVPLYTPCRVRTQSVEKHQIGGRAHAVHASSLGARET